MQPSPSPSAGGAHNDLSTMAQREGSAPPILDSPVRIFSFSSASLHLFAMGAQTHTLACVRFSPWRFQTKGKRTWSSQWKTRKMEIMLAFEEPTSSRGARVLAYFLTLTILVNTTAIVVQSLPTVRPCSTTARTTFTPLASHSQSHLIWFVRCFFCSTLTTRMRTISFPLSRHAAWQSLRWTT